MELFKLFFKSKGGESTLDVNTEYHTNLYDIEANGFEELGQKATNIIREFNMPVEDFGIDVLRRGEDYPKERTNGTGKEQEFFTNHTGKH